MSLSQKAKTQNVDAYRRSAGDTGSPEVQVALLTGRIEQLTQHMKAFPKDLHTRLGFMRLIGKRRRLLKYLKRTRPEVYAHLIAQLGIRG